jgi:hypothetical protein
MHASRPRLHQLYNADEALRGQNGFRIKSEVN